VPLVDIRVLIAWSSSVLSSSSFTASVSVFIFFLLSVVVFLSKGIGRQWGQPIFGFNRLRVHWPSSIINMVLLTYNVNLTISLCISLGAQGLKLGQRTCSDLLTVEGQVCSV
ncbi:hypothetical protein B0H14DRAFT_2876702, partial [Mycena olivaceomarginata]